MKILVAPDKFKGVLTARQAAESIAAGIRDELPSAKIELQPVADGGEGTAGVICEALGGVWRTVASHSASGEPCQARYCWVAKVKTAVFEMSEVAGLKGLSAKSVELERLSTFGVGEIMLDAARAGAKEIAVGLGGSMTNDGGFGMARALGYEFLNADEEVLPENVLALTKLKHIRKPGTGLGAVKILAATDVMNPLLGSEGATRVFASQKGANSGQIEHLEEALTTLADVVERDLSIKARNYAGAGAAGGLGFGLASFCGAELVSGFEFVARVIDLERKVADADVVVTGEGSLDSQTLVGKAPGQVAAMASRLGKRVFAVVGRADEDERLQAMFEGIFEVTGDVPIDAELVQRAPDLLRDGGRVLAAHLAGRART
jgi:glycerate kinase